jgi:hypothetical protein
MAYANDENPLRDTVETTKKNTETVIDANKEVDL